TLFIRPQSALLDKSDQATTILTPGAPSGRWLQLETIPSPRPFCRPETAAAALPDSPHLPVVRSLQLV
ncbi:hypothetical protein ACV1DR_22055, partial [Aeromonas jandaei]